MIVSIEHVAIWRLIYQREQMLIDENTDRKDSSIPNHQIKVDDQLLIRINQGKNMKPHIRDHTPSYKRGPMERWR